MKKILMTFVTSIALFTTVAVTAGEFAKLREAVMTARDTLVTLVKHPDKRGAAQQKLVKDTADAVSAKIATMSAPPGKEAQFKEMTANWAAFKKTREEELVPLILAGKQAEGKAIAMGIQKERLMKVLTLCDELDK